MGEPIAAGTKLYDSTDELVRAAIGASQRTRRILFFSQVFGLVVLVIYANTEFTYWSRSRRQLVTAAQILYRCPQRPDFIFAWSSSTPGMQPTGAVLSRFRDLRDFSPRSGP